MAETRKRRKSDAARRANQTIHSRTLVLMGIFGVFTFLLLFWKLYDLQIVRHDELRVEEALRAEAVAGGAGALRAVEGEQPRLDLLDGEAAFRAGELGAEDAALLGGHDADAEVAALRPRALAQLPEAREPEPTCLLAQR